MESSDHHHAGSSRHEFLGIRMMSWLNLSFQISMHIRVVVAKRTPSSCHMAATSPVHPSSGIRTTRHCRFNAETYPGDTTVHRNSGPGFLSDRGSCQSG